MCLNSGRKLAPWARGGFDGSREDVHESTAKLLRQLMAGDAAKGSATLDMRLCTRRQISGRRFLDFSAER